MTDYALCKVHQLHYDKAQGCPCCTEATQAPKAASDDFCGANDRPGGQRAAKGESGALLKPMDRVPFGKHKGLLAQDVPYEYMIWANQNWDRAAFAPECLAEAPRHEVQGGFRIIGDDEVLWFGKHKGTKASDVPDSYVRFVHENFDGVQFSKERTEAALDSMEDNDRDHRPWKDRDE